MAKRNYRLEARKLILEVTYAMDKLRESIAGPSFDNNECKNCWFSLKKLDPNRLIWNGLIIRGKEINSGPQKRKRLEKERLKRLLQAVMEELKANRLKPLE